jgi:RNA polymerase sigma factor (TIGR02999 family)
MAPMNAPQRLTDLLIAWRRGDDDAHRDARREALNREIYAALKRMAAGRWLDAGKPGTLSPTALVNEAVARLLDGNVDWSSRSHFFALAALQMRAVLIDYARSRHAAKRGGGVAAVTLEGLEIGTSTDDELLDLDAALIELTTVDARAARVIELTYFGGMKAHEVAEVCDIGLSTVEKDLAYARAWLHRRLG